MRKVKVTCSIPSWNFCNIDKLPEKLSAQIGPSKELCRFCVKKNGNHHCTLYDRALKADGRFTYKVPACIDAAATGLAVEEPAIRIDPALIIDETLKLYKKTMNDLLNQGYPRNIAETVATKYVKDGGPT